MKKFISFILAAMLCLGFVGCSESDKDNDNNNDGGGGGSPSSYEELLIGTWEIYKSYHDGAWDYDYGEDKGWSLIYSFDADGTGIHKVFEYGSWWGCLLEWDLVKETFLDITTYDAEDDNEVAYIDRLLIESLDEKELVVYWGGELTYFRRVKKK
ncbi:MAG: hypothetical protein IIY05_00755 [Alistipes sp.]|nr:hypothetical protein [Alistipes sp.]